MYPRILYPLLAYRSMVAPILTLCMAVVPCWFVFRLYRRRTLEHHVSFRRELLLLAFVVYLAALASATLTPNHSARYDKDPTMGVDLRPSQASLTCTSASLRRNSTARAFCMRNARGNLLLFFPFGLFVPLVWRRIGFRRGLAIAVAASCSIELVQYFSRSWVHRSADVNDVILNSAGACIGLVIAHLLRSRIDARSRVSRA